MGAEVEFGILGSVQVLDGERRLPMTAASSRTLLAAMLVRLGQVVTVRKLAGYLWGEAQPGNPRAAIHNYVRRLREALGDRAHGGLVRTGDQGYLLALGDSRLDLVEFRTLVDRATGTAELADRVALLERALGLWRGEPLADVTAESLVEEVAPGLVEERLTAVETLVDARLRLGRYSATIAELSRLTAEHPLRERFWAQRVVALAGAGQQAEALRAYDEIRSRLRTELRVEPGSELQAAQLHVLRQDLPVEAPRTVSPPLTLSAPNRHVVPELLPGDVAAFTGRSGPLAALDSGLPVDGEPTGSAVVISAIGGTGGVGKTALAVHWAHRVRERFPDGQLYVDLRGYGPGQPLSAVDALAGFLRSLGVDGADLPPEVGERAALFRTVVNGRRILLVLDNAGAVDQVRPLLPGSPTCLVVVTSRDTLPGLVARDGARRVRLDLMTPAEAAELLRSLLGDRVAAEPAAAAALVEQCAGLPLALRLAAEVAASRPEAGLADLVAELADERRRLDLVGGPADSVRGVFSSSYRTLPADTARVFRLLGLPPGEDIDEYAVAALAGIDLAAARRHLATLTRRTLVDEPTPGRFRMHDLLRSFAAEAVRDLDSEEDRRAAVTRLLDHYVWTARRAAVAMMPHEDSRQPEVPPSGSAAPELETGPRAVAWLDAERQNLLAVAGHAAESHWPRHAALLSSILFRYLDNGSHYEAGLRVHLHGANAARRCGDRAIEGKAMGSLAAAHYRLGRYDAAVRHYEAALAVVEDIGDLTLQARTLCNLGLALTDMGRNDEAVARYRIALRLARQTADLDGEAIVLTDLAIAESRIGNYADAVDHLGAALEVASKIGAPGQEGLCLINLAEIYEQLGLVDEAYDAVVRARDAVPAVGNLSFEIETLNTLGSCLGNLGRYDEAIASIEQALELGRDTGEARVRSTSLTCLGAVYRRMGRADRAVALQTEAVGIGGGQVVEAVARNALGESLLALGDPVGAAEQHEAAMSLIKSSGIRREIARSHLGLARAARAAGELAESRTRYAAALELLTALGVVDAADVRAELGVLEPGPTPANSG